VGHKPKQKKNNKKNKQKRSILTLAMKFSLLKEVVTA
jgi:hypothetical protein